MIYLSADCGVKTTREVDRGFRQVLRNLLIQMYTKHQQGYRVGIGDVYCLHTIQHNQDVNLRYIAYKQYNTTSMLTKSLLSTNNMLT